MSKFDSICLKHNCSKCCDPVVLRQGTKKSWGKNLATYRLRIEMKF